MSFFLIGKGPDDVLTLLADRVFATRADAMAELSRLTADEGFTLWDHEVVVVDLQGATPVLLVRPASARSDTAPASEPASIATGDKSTPEPVEDASEPVEEALQPTEEPAVTHDETSEREVEPAPDSAQEDSSLAAVLEGLDDDGTSSVDLKEALRRSAVSLEAEGIVAPESIGPAETESAADGEELDTPKSGVDEAPSDAMVVEAAAEPSWPWATQEDRKSFDLDALEEPGDDEESLVRAPGDDETMSVARPVILGAYESGPTEDRSDVDALLSELEGPDASPESPNVVTHPPIPVPPPLPEPPAVPESAPDAVDAQTDATVDTIADSMSVTETAPATPDVPAPESDFVDLPSAAIDPIDQMTCDDCVYTDSCPNKGQRDPASCGSFQWK